MADLLVRREKAFVLWHLAQAEPPPRLIIGWVQPGTPLTLIGEQSLALRRVPGFDDLWELPAAECGLNDGWVYYYWFEITSSHPERPSGLTPTRIRITDPLATAVDGRLLGPRLGAPFTAADRYPAAAVKYSGGRLVSADVGGEQPSFSSEPPAEALPPLNRLVIYKLPTTWARPRAARGREMGVSSFRDISALIDADATGATFADLDVTRPGRAYLSNELGVNALELLAGTSHYFAPNSELGFPSTYSWPAPNRDLTELSRTCHSHRMRFIADMPMASSQGNPYLDAAYDDFFSDASSFRYDHFVQTYDPVSGVAGSFCPARQLMKTAVERWVRDFHIDGIRIDDIASPDFVNELARDRFLVLAKEPRHEAFKHYIRMALIGLPHENEATFEATLRRAIDCREFGYEDLTQALIYLTSDDLEGFRNERLFDFFANSAVFDAEKRTKLAFACLLTAVGLPMILAGEEFADQHDSLSFSRLQDDWRARIKDYASRLIQLRTSYDALAVNEVEFIHADFDEGKRVMAWRRGEAGSASQVVVVANFSDFATPDADQPHAEYVINNWPAAPSNRRWREVPQQRWVDDARAGREPLYAWEAKVYALY